MTLDRATVEQMLNWREWEPIPGGALARIHALAEDWLRQEETLRLIAEGRWATHGYPTGMLGVRKLARAALASRPQAEEEKPDFGAEDKEDAEKEPDPRKRKRWGYKGRRYT